MRLRLLVLFVALAVGMGCEKSGPTASGELTADESAQLANLPRNADFVFGGNLMRLQKYLERSPLGKVMSAMDSVAPGMKNWTNCLAEHKDVTMLGTIEAARTIEMRFVMVGLGIDDLEKCGKAAKFTTTVDPDRKYISIETTGQYGSKLGYFVLPNGGIYGKQTMRLGGPAAVTAVPLDRASFDADVASAAKDSAAKNQNLLTAIAKVDRTKSMWFAGNAANTPIGGRVGELFGSLDFGDGMRIDFTALMKDKKLATEIVTGFNDAKEASGMLGPELKGVLDAIKITQDGDRLRLVLKLTDAQLDTLFSKMAPFMGR